MEDIKHMVTCSVCFSGNSKAVLILGLVAALSAGVTVAAIVVLWVWRRR